MKTFTLKLSALTALGIVLGTVSATAQEDEDFFIRNKYQAVTDRAQPEFDPLPIRLGSFQAVSEVDFSLGTTSNLFATSEDEIDDVFLRFAPQFNLDSDWGRHALGVFGSVDHLEYTDTTSESRTNIRVGADGRLDVSSAFALFGALQAEDLVEPRSNISSLQNAEEPIEYSRLGGEVGARYESGRIRIRGALGLQSSDYDDVELTNGLIQDQDFRDRDELSATVRVAYAVERDWALFAEATRDESDYDAPNIFNAINRDSEGTILRVGSDFELSSLLRGDIGIGYQQYEYDDPTLTDVDGLAIAGNLQWFVTQLTTISSEAERRVIDPGIVTTNAAVQTSLNARVDHELLRNILLTGEARFTNFDFENINRDDDRYNFRVGASWKLNRNIWVDGSYQLTDQSSNVQDFTDNRFLVGIRIFP